MIRRMYNIDFDQQHIIFSKLMCSVYPYKNILHVAIKFIYNFYLLITRVSYGNYDTTMQTINDHTQRLER